MTDEELIKRLRSQVGDDVQHIYDHEALFRISADRIEALLAENKRDGERAAALMVHHFQRAERLAAALVQCRGLYQVTHIHAAIDAALKGADHD